LSTTSSLKISCLFCHPKCFFLFDCSLYNSLTFLSFCLEKRQVLQTHYDKGFAEQHISSEFKNLAYNAIFILIVSFPFIHSLNYEILFHLVQYIHSRALSSSTSIFISGLDFPKVLTIHLFWGPYNLPSKVTRIPEEERE